MSEPWLTPLLGLALIVAMFTGVWLLSLRTHDVGVIDIAWGPGFVLLAWFAALRQMPGHDSATLVLLAVTLWGARLGAHMLVRHSMSAGEDARYAAMRADDRQRFWWISLPKVFWLQAIILWMLAVPIHLAMATGREGTPGMLAVTGLVVFMAGFALETVADLMLLRARRTHARRTDPAAPGPLVTTGVFAWSRHPNYFGECLLWAGIALMAWDASGSAVALLGPLALTALILKVSGIPLLEDHLRRTRPGYAAYAARTSAFIPWLPQKD